MTTPRRTAKPITDSVTETHIITRFRLFAFKACPFSFCSVTLFPSIFYSPSNLISFANSATNAFAALICFGFQKIYLQPCSKPKAVSIFYNRFYVRFGVQSDDDKGYFHKHDTDGNSCESICKQYYQLYENPDQNDYDRIG